MKKTLIPQDILARLSSATFEGNEMRLSSTLDRGVYQKVAKVIEDAGGKWNRSAAAHVFPGDAYEAIEPIILTGEMVRPSDMGQFDTPEELAASVAEWAMIEEGNAVLEPSAGIGMLIMAILPYNPSIVRAIEIDIGRVRYMRNHFDKHDDRVKIRHVDFLKADPDRVAERFDRVVMNPPFAKQADIDHVLHAWRFVKPGGRLISIMSAGAQFRQDRKTISFHNWLFNKTEGGHFLNLEAGAFKKSGTNVNAIVFRAVKPT